VLGDGGGIDLAFGQGGQLLVSGLFLFEGLFQQRHDRVVTHATGPLGAGAIGANLVVLCALRGCNQNRVENGPTRARWGSCASRGVRRCYSAVVRIGVDLGGSKIEAIGLSTAGEIVDRRRMPTPRDDYGATLRALALLVHDIERTTGQRGTVGIGIPGTISSATGLVKNANSTWLNGKPLSQDVSELLQRPVRFANDANCFALSEATDGAAANQPVVFGVIIGTGTGGGVVVDGRVISGVNGVAGEWGHNPLPWPRESEWPGPPCYCGRTGCIETFLSGPGLARDFVRVAGRALDAESLVAAAVRGDDAAITSLERYEDRLARALASVINVLDPDVIVLGGGLSNIDRLYSSIPARWGPYVFSDLVATRLIKAKHGDSSGVRGAAWLWQPQEAESRMA
jgi:fructokinase